MININDILNSNNNINNNQNKNNTNKNHIFQLERERHLLVESYEDKLRASQQKLDIRLIVSFL